LPDARERAARTKFTPPALIRVTARLKRIMAPEEKQNGDTAREEKSGLSLRSRFLILFVVIFLGGAPPPAMA
jgi:hypothetical protein